MPQIIKHRGELIRINPQDRQRIEWSRNGTYWHERYSGSRYGDFYELTDNGEEILAETSDGLYYSEDGGMIWYKRDGDKDDNTFGCMFYSVVFIIIVVCAFIANKCVL